MTDKEFLQHIAKLWVELGGDAEGLDWNVSKLKEAIKKEMEE